MTLQKIYIHLIDGTDVWVLINARQIREGQFEIANNHEYNEAGNHELFQFFPGDVVELDEHVLPDGTKRKVAKKLVSQGQWPDRKFHEFKYKATLKQLSIDKQTADFFREEIDRIKTAYSNGEIFYPTVIETLSKLDNLIK